MSKYDEFITDKMFPDCPIRNILARIANKWSLLVIYTLNGRVMRFNALQRALPDISQKMLAQTLRMLETDGLVQRKVYAEVPPRVEYALTDRARSLLPCLESLIGWAEENMADILKDRERSQELATEKA